MQKYKENKNKLIPIHLNQERLLVTCMFLQVIGENLTDDVMSNFKKPFNEVKDSLINVGFDEHAFNEPVSEIFQIFKTDGKVVEWSAKTIKRILVALSIIDETLDGHVLSPKIQDVEDYLVVRMIESLS